MLNNRVALTYVGDARISTVYLFGIDHQFGDGPPLLYETLVFDGLLDGEMKRYTTQKQAKAGHKAMVARVRRAK